MHKDMSRKMTDYDEPKELIIRDEISIEKKKRRVIFKQKQVGGREKAKSAVFVFIHQASYGCGFRPLSRSFPGGPYLHLT